MLLTPSPCHKLSHLLGSPPSPECDVRYGRPLTISRCLTACHNSTSVISIAVVAIVFAAFILTLLTSCYTT